MATPARSFGTTACTKKYGNITTYGGRTNVPVVFEDQLLISAVLVGWGDTPEFDGLARPVASLHGFDKATGELRWLAEHDDRTAGYEATARRRWR